jgi:hypothetical protein
MNRFQRRTHSGLYLGDTCSILPNGARVCSSENDAWHQPDLNTQPWSDVQKLSAAARVTGALNAPPFLNKDMSLFNAPADSRPFIITPNPFPAYPAPNAGPIDVIKFVVPPGFLAVISAVAIVHNGGNPPDGTGNVVWRMLINGAGVDGLNNLTSQVGTYAQPNSFTIVAIENDIVRVTVEVPNGQQAMPAGQTTAARFHGWRYPLVEATKAANGV